MRSINVSTDVFSLIWASRLDNEESEDEILRRLLRRKPSNALPQISSNSDLTEGQKPAVPAKLRNAYWWEVVSFALTKLGRPSSLSDIYKEVTWACRECDRHMPETLEATVRGTLEDNSSDSDRYKGVRDIFCMPNGKHTGVWSLRNFASIKDVGGLQKGLEATP